MAESYESSNRRFPSWLIPIAIVVVAAFIIYRLFAGSYNNMVTYDEEVNEKWASVEGAYQRRADLIPNLVNTVKGYADFEQETLTKVIEARSKATSITIDPTNLTPENIQQFQQVQGEVSSALSRLLVTIERYPDLKANQNFLELQAQLEGTENRIKVARDKYNESVKGYNTYTRRFPQNIVAGIFGFDRKVPFEATPGSDVAPKVEF